MIKVNLLRNRVQGARADTTQANYTFAQGTAIGDGASSNRVALVNLIVIALLPLALLIYENQVISDLNAKQSVVQVELSGLQGQVTEKSGKIGDLASLEKDAKTLDDKLKILTTLSKLRLREIKSLDFIQSAIPEKAWLKSLGYEGEKLLIQGVAITDDDLNEFVKALENSAYFRDVILLQSREERQVDGSVKIFEISCNVQTQD